MLNILTKKCLFSFFVACVIFRIPLHVSIWVNSFANIILDFFKFDFSIHLISFKIWSDVSWHVSELGVSPIFLQVKKKSNLFIPKISVKEK